MVIFLNPTWAIAHCLVLLWGLLSTSKVGYALRSKPSGFILCPTTISTSFDMYYSTSMMSSPFIYQIIFKWNVILSKLQFWYEECQFFGLRGQSWFLPMQLGNGQNYHQKKRNFKSFQTIYISKQSRKGSQLVEYWEFKMLENILCTLGWGLGEKLLRKRQKLMSLLIMFSYLFKYIRINIW